MVLIISIDRTEKKAFIIIFFDFWLGDFVSKTKPLAISLTQPKYQPYTPGTIHYAWAVSFPLTLSVICYNPSVTDIHVMSSVGIAYMA